MTKSAKRRVFSNKNIPFLPLNEIIAITGFALVMANFGIFHIKIAVIGKISLKFILIFP